MATNHSDLRQQYRDESTSQLLNQYDLLSDKLDLIEEELMFRQASGQKIQADSQITMIEKRLFASS